MSNFSRTPTTVSSLYDASIVLVSLYLPSLVHMGDPSEKLYVFCFVPWLFNCKKVAGDICVSLCN